MLTEKQVQQISALLRENCSESPFILFVMDLEGIQSVSNVGPENRAEFIKDLFVNIFGAAPTKTTQIERQ